MILCHAPSWWLCLPSCSIYWLNSVQWVVSCQMQLCIFLIVIYSILFSLASVCEWFHARCSCFFSQRTSFCSDPVDIIWWQLVSNSGVSSQTLPIILILAYQIVSDLMPGMVVFLITLAPTSIVSLACGLFCHIRLSWLTSHHFPSPIDLIVCKKFHIRFCCVNSHNSFFCPGPVDQCVSNSGAF